MKKLIAFCITLAIAFLLIGCNQTITTEPYQRNDYSVDSTDITDIINIAETLNQSINLYDLGDRQAVLTIGIYHLYILDKTSGGISEITDFTENTFQMDYSEDQQRFLAYTKYEYVIIDNDSYSLVDEDLEVDFWITEASIIDRDYIALTITNSTTMYTYGGNIEFETKIVNQEGEEITSGQFYHVQDDVFYYRYSQNSSGTTTMVSKFYQFTGTEMTLIRQTSWVNMDVITYFGQNIIIKMYSTSDSKVYFDVYEIEEDGSYTYRTSLSGYSKLIQSNEEFLQAYKTSSVSYFNTHMEEEDTYTHEWDAEYEFYPLTSNYSMRFNKDTYQVDILNSRQHSVASITLENICAYIWGDQIEVAGGMLLDVGSVYLLFDGNDLSMFETLIDVTDDAIYYESDDTLYVFQNGESSEFEFSELSDALSSGTRYEYRVFDTDNVLLIFSGYGSAPDTITFLSNTLEDIEGEIIAQNGNSFLIALDDGSYQYLNF